MAGERFQVRTVVGYPIRPGGSGRPGGTTRVGASAAVLDRLDAWREVGTFRSEAGEPSGRGRLGALGAVKAAEALAAELNAEHRAAA